MHDIAAALGLTETMAGACTGSSWLKCGGEEVACRSPIDNQLIAAVQQATAEDYARLAATAREAFLQWRTVPAPRRGEIVRQIGNAVRAHKRELGALVSLEVGKIRVEAEGEVQEMIDICDFAVGQSRMLYGLSMHSERPRHRMYEQWLPLGPIGVITAFNFPVAVWSWNAMIALVAGDPVVWKPSSKACLTALALMKIIAPVLAENRVPEGVLNVIIGGRHQVGEALVQDRGLPLVSATGSVAMGREVARKVSSRLGRTLLELGGNNAVIVTPSADLQLAVRAILFGAVGTAGQRCTTIRRAIVHREIFASFTESLIGAYRQVVVGNPLEDGVLMGPLIDGQAVARMQEALEKLQDEGGRILYGGEVLSGGLYDAGTYVRPCICEASNDFDIVKQETFAPILYVIPYDDLQEAIHYQNDVPQGLSSAIFTSELGESELFLSCEGSDCGIANVNIGTSGAEIGGAFGGEKDTGGGREAGSDAWKAYMRRQTVTINWSRELPLAQGIEFDVES
ncbi:MAG: aldehyde dehydrogenase family protein [Deltaproteobacteria bacterium]|nr:aldehyde dehydrogenase family protein [Deltaproteobacteria bacterium]MBW2070489.1 aldehyde dehydrogenase family protein [Deltaproteobacteria bacterium]